MAGHIWGEAVTNQDVERCNFKGKWVADMNRDELLEMIGWLSEERRRGFDEQMAMLAALRDTGRKRGGAFMNCLFGSEA